jgi:hypothetical protein
VSALQVGQTLLSLVDLEFIWIFAVIVLFSWCVVCLGVGPTRLSYFTLHLCER